MVNALSAYAHVHEIGALMYALRIVNGFSHALVFNANVTFATNLSPPHKLARAIGLCGAASMLSNAVVPNVAESLADLYNWRLVFELAASAAFVAALLSLGVQELHAPRGTASPTETNVPSGRELRGAGKLCFGASVCRRLHRSAPHHVIRRGA